MLLSPPMQHSLDTVLRHVGTDATTAIRTRPGTADWQWWVNVPQFNEDFIAFTGSLLGCLAIDAAYAVA